MTDHAARPMTEEELVANGYPRDFHSLSYQERQRIVAERVQQLSGSSLPVVAVGDLAAATPLSMKQAILNLQNFEGRVDHKTFAAILDGLIHGSPMMVVVGDYTASEVPAIDVILTGVTDADQAPDGILEMTGFINGILTTESFRTIWSEQFDHKPEETVTKIDLDPERAFGVDLDGEKGQG